VKPPSAITKLSTNLFN